MPEKDGDEAKSTKSVVNKKQKQIMNQEDFKPLPIDKMYDQYEKKRSANLKKGPYGDVKTGTKFGKSFSDTQIDSRGNSKQTKKMSGVIRNRLMYTEPIQRAHSKFRSEKNDRAQAAYIKSLGLGEEFSDRQRSDMKNLLTKNFGDESTAKNTAIKVKASRAKEITGQSAVRDAQKYASGEYAKLGGGERMSLKMKGRGAATAGANPTKTGGPKENPKSLGGKSKGNTPVNVNVKKKIDMGKYFGGLGEEGYDHLRDRGMVRPSKDKKDATTMPPSKEMEKTRKVNKGPSALDIVKKKYKGQIMKVEELDLTKVAEAFGGYIIEAKVTSDDDRTTERKSFEKKKKRFVSGDGTVNVNKSNPSSFIGDEEPTQDDVKPKKDKVTTGSGEDKKGQKGDTVTYGQPDEVKPKQGRLSKLATAAAANPATALIAYDLGKGIIGKISKLRAPAVVGGKAGFRSAGGYQAT